MTFDSEAFVHGGAAEIADAEVRALRRERIAVAISTTLAVLVVAAIAVLMGLA